MSCVICGEYSQPDNQYCISHQDGIPEFRKKVTEKTRLKREARYLKRQIAKGKALLMMHLTWRTFQKKALTHSSEAKPEGWESETT